MEVVGSRPASENMNIFYMFCFYVIGQSTAMENWIKRKRRDCFNVLYIYIYIEVNSTIVYINIH